MMKLDRRVASYVGGVKKSRVISFKRWWRNGVISFEYMRTGVSISQSTGDVVKVKSLGFVVTGE